MSGPVRLRARDGASALALLREGEDFPAAAGGIYTTLRTAGGRAVLAGAHLARLGANCAAAGLPAPPDAVTFSAWIAEAVVHTGGEARIRVECRPPGEWRVTGMPLDPPAELKLWIAPPGSARELPELKVTDRARIEALETVARAAGADEVLLRDSEGATVESSRSNFYAVDPDGAVVTPDSGALPGVALAWVLQQLRARGTAVRRERLAPGRLAASTELFASSAVKGPVPVVTLIRPDGPPGIISEGPVVKYLRARWLELLDETARGARIPS